MREVSEKIYKFEELTDVVQRKVLDKFRENETFDYLEDDLNEHLNELLKENGITEGIKGKKILYDLSFYQGSGLCFIGGFLWKDYHIRIMQEGRYYNNDSITFEITDVNDDEAPEEIYNEFKVLYKKITNQLERQGRDEIEYQEKDETIIENINANDYEFYADGRIYR